MPTYAVRTWLVIALATAVGWSSSAAAAVKPVSASATAERNTGQPVEVYMTTWDGAKRLSQEAGVSFRPDRNPHPYTIHVDESRTYQTMDGYGASLTDSSAYVIYHHLDEKKRTELMRQLFDPVQGLGLSYLRLPMGASDFALNDYTYDDMPEGQVDPDLEHFSIEHDRAYILPVLKQALKINPQLKVMGTPWSAPAWMKSTGRLQKGKLLTEYYGAYAQYFVKFIRAYAAEGVPIHAVTLQNEPQYEPSGYPGMTMEPEDQAEFVKNHLGPAFREAGIKTEIIVWDHNWDHPEYPIEVLNDEEAKPYIAGSAFHSYGGAVENQAQVHDEHPDKGIYFTESSGVTEYPVFGDNVNWDLSNLLIRSTRYWAKTVLKWNLALDENNGPLNGGCSTCRGVVTVTSDGSVTLNEEYYAFGHASKFVQPGAVRIASNTFGPGSLETAAFRNPDGSKALIVLNGAGEEREFQVRWGNASYTYKLPAKAAATFKWNGRTGAGTDGINPYSRVEAEEAAELRGVRAGIARDTAGGGLVGSDSGAGGYIAFKDVEVVSGTASADIRYASAQDVRIELRLGSPNGAYVGELDTGATGGDQMWATKRIPVEIPPGTHKLFLVFKSPVNLNWFQFGFTSAKELHNYAARNGSFEDGAPGPWQGWSPEGQASAQKVESGDAHSGEYKLIHWSAGPYMQGTSRTIEVPNGTYQASVWVKKGDGIETRLTIRNYGGPEMSAEAGNGGISYWKQLTTGPFLVTSGRVELELHSEAAKSEWAAFDDVELKPVPTAAPAAPTAHGAPPAPRQVTASVVGEGQSIRLSWEGAKGAAHTKSTVP
ncbi:carbohydrate-binding protein [Paenibacillus sp. S-38]|uniref:carbohydrate-binding protein n=1 Tax=Paenibacillus sp. S-38 TaxID=3416710 RepID=UPI003CF46325